MVMTGDILSSNCYHHHNQRQKFPEEKMKKLFWILIAFAVDLK
jgi:hypothetical protein